MLSKLFLFFTAVASVTADDVMAYPQLKRAVLEPRQSIIPDLPVSCTTDVLKILTSLPTPPARLLTATALTNPCSATVPDSLTSDYSSYSSRLSSWYDGHSSEISSIFSDCPELRSLASSLPVCATSFLGGALQTGGSTTTTGSETSTETSTSTTSTTTGGAARETGAAVAALAAAGLLAAIF
jgi:hypothetical protein